MTKTNAAADKRQKRTHSHKFDVTQPKAQGIGLDTESAHRVLSPHNGWKRRDGSTHSPLNPRGNSVWPSQSRLLLFFHPSQALKCSEVKWWPILLLIFFLQFCILTSFLPHLELRLWRSHICRERKKWQTFKKCRFHTVEVCQGLHNRPTDN